MFCLLSLSFNSNVKAGECISEQNAHVYVLDPDNKKKLPIQGNKAILLDIMLKDKDFPVAENLKHFQYGKNGEQRRVAVFSIVKGIVDDPWMEDHPSLQESALDDMASSTSRQASSAADKKLAGSQTPIDGRSRVEQEERDRKLACEQLGDNSIAATSREASNVTDKKPTSMQASTKSCCLVM